jgi:hypothetical protein
MREKRTTTLQRRLTNDRDVYQNHVKVTEVADAREIFHHDDYCDFI